MMSTPRGPVPVPGPQTEFIRVRRARPRATGPRPAAAHVRGVSRHAQPRVAWAVSSLPARGSSLPGPRFVPDEGWSVNIMSNGAVSSAAACARHGPARRLSPRPGPAHRADPSPYQSHHSRARFRTESWPAPGRDGRRRGCWGGRAGIPRSKGARAPVLDRHLTGAGPADRVESGPWPVSPSRIRVRESWH